MRVQAGAAAVDITPGGEFDLSGYAARRGAASGVHDRLAARAVVLESEGTRIALVALDLIGTSVPFDRELRGAIAATTGIPASHVLVNCSHTHAGPAVAGLAGLGEPQDEYVVALPGRIAKAVSAAASSLTPITVNYGEAPVRVGINRREATPTGVHLGRNPNGLVDDRVRVLVLEQEGGPPLATLFHHACHGTTLSGENTLVSAEWMGAACAALAASGAGLPVFLQGCAGQTNPDDEERSFDAIGRLGVRMSEAVQAAREVATPVTTAPLRAEVRIVAVRLQAPPSAEAAALQVAETEAEAVRADGNGERYLARAFRQRAASMRTVLGLTGSPPQAVEITLSAARLGEVALLGFSGEVFLEYARRIAAASPFAHTCVLGYTDGCACYVPTAAALAEGGYEAEDSFLWYGTRPFVPESEEYLVQQAGQMLTALWE